MTYDEALADRIRELVEDEHGVSEKRMFGGLAFLINGHMAASASNSGGMLLRCAPADTARFLDEPGAHPFEMRGREMDGWLRVDTADLSDAAVRDWVRRGVEYARSLPPK